MPHAQDNPWPDPATPWRKPSASAGYVPSRHQTRTSSVNQVSDPQLHFKAAKSQNNDAIQPPDYPNVEESFHLPSLPRMWKPAIDELIGRTSRAYKVVINYGRDSRGGYRWCPEDIAQVRTMGAYLDDDIRGLYQLRRVIAKRGQDNQTMLRRVEEDAERLRELCEAIQALISATERRLPTEV